MSVARLTALSWRLLCQRDPLKTHSQGRNQGPEKVHFRSVPVQVREQFQLLQKCHCCYFQHQPKHNFSSVANSSSLVGISSVGAALLLSPGWDTPAQQLLPMSHISPGLPHPALPTATLQAPQKIAKDNPFLWNQQQKATEVHGDGNGPCCGFWLCSHFQ